MTPDQRLEYELSLSVERDLSAALDTSFEDGMEKGKAEGMKDGIEQGMKKGKEEGMKHGIEKGKEEGKAEEQRLIATNLKKQGINIETIAQCTGLSLKEISGL